MSGLVTGFAPFICKDSKLLILGSFPSVKSRLNNFYYGNPRNRFWYVLSTFFHRPLPETVEEKKALLKEEKVALWDVVTECEIHASRDDSIKNFKVADVDGLLHNFKIGYIIVNGGTAYNIFKRYCRAEGVCVMPLPSTSPANTRLDEEKWYEALRKVFT